MRNGFGIRNSGIWKSRKRRWGGDVFKVELSFLYESEMLITPLGNERPGMYPHSWEMNPWI